MAFLPVYVTNFGIFGSFGIFWGSAPPFLFQDSQNSQNTFRVSVFSYRFSARTGATGKITVCPALRAYLLCQPPLFRLSVVGGLIIGPIGLMGPICPAQALRRPPICVFRPTPSPICLICPIGPIRLCFTRRPAYATAPRPGGGREPPAVTIRPIGLMGPINPKLRCAARQFASFDQRQVLYVLYVLSVLFACTSVGGPRSRQRNPATYAGHTVIRPLSPFRDP